MHVVAPALGPTWLDPQTILHALGPWALWGAVGIVFAECGLLIGFFLPGDSLLFTVGLLVSTGVIRQPLWLACSVLTVAAFIGNVSGYEIGRRTGPAIFHKEDSRLFRKEYVDKTVAFFDKYGARAIVLARFVPIVRTFITVIAGVGQMDRRRFLTYSGIGGALWAMGVTILGSLLGQFSFINKNIEAILLAIVLVSVIPVIVEFLRERAKTRRADRVPPTPGTPSAAPAASPAGPTVPAVSDSTLGSDSTLRSGARFDSTSSSSPPFGPDFGGQNGRATPPTPGSRPARGGRHVS
jgi:membrane-associated protein